MVTYKGSLFNDEGSNRNQIIRKGELTAIWNHCITCYNCRAKLFEIIYHLDEQTTSDIEELMEK